MTAPTDDVDPRRHGLDREAERLAWQVAVDAAGVGAFDWDLVTGRLTWDERLLDLFGLDDDTFGGTIESFNAAVHPDDLERVGHALQAAIATCGEYAAEYRVVRPGGEVRWLAARGRALPGADRTAVRLLGAAYDTTAVRDGEARVARVLETMPSAFFHLDRDWRFSYVNAEAERLLGASRAELAGGVVWELFPASVASDFETHYRSAMRSGQPKTFDAYYPAPLDAWYEVHAWPTPDGLSVYFVDITLRRQVQDELAQAASRNAFAAAVTANLTGTLDVNEAVGRLAPMVVPLLADWCVVSLVDDRDPHAPWRRWLRDVGWWHVDPRMRPVLEQYAAVRVEALTEDSFVGRALASREPVVIEGGAVDLVSSVLGTDESRALLRELAPSSAVVVQMRGRGRVTGMLTVFRGADRAPFSPEEVATLVDVATRAGLALDTARTYAGQRDLAETLQRSLLTEPPQPDDLQFAVRYEPAAEQAQVGGDWYDAFVQPDGPAVLVIGDVVGHDTAAAAAMGQLRGLLRGIAAHTGDGPADVLEGVDRALQTLGVDTTATAVVARLEQSEEERARGVTRLRWSNAGHPPPMLLLPDGTVDALAAEGANLLLGFSATTDRDEHVVNLHRGATLLLYTDGLVERRGESIDDGLARLAATLAALAEDDPDLETLCDRVLRTMLLDRPDDDVALVAVRLHAEGAPRS